MVSHDLTERHVSSVRLELCDGLLPAEPRLSDVHQHGGAHTYQTGSERPRDPGSAQIELNNTGSVCGADRHVVTDRLLPTLI